MPRASAPVLLSALLSLLVGTSRANAQPDVSRPNIRESVSVETKSAVIKRINDAREYIAGQRWQLAVDILQEMLTNGEQALVPLRPGLYVSTERRCHLLLSNLPAAGRAVYRRKADPQARIWFEAALKDRDEAGMRRVIRRAFASSYGDDALWQLGQWQWERGDIDGARHCWSQILPLPPGSSAEKIATTLRCPATDLDLPLIEARCAMCELMQGRFARAEKSLAELKRRYPKAQGTIAGRKGLLSELLARTIRDARKWQFPRPGSDSATFAVNNARNAVLPAPLDIGAIRWSRKIDWQTLPVPESPGLPRRPHPACFPVSVDGVIYLAVADRVFAYDAVTGRPAFPADGGRNDPIESQAVIYPPVPDQPLPPPIRDTVGVARFCVTVHDGRLYARIGSPVTGRTRNEVRAARSTLICYRLGAETGRLEWNTAAQRFGRGWEFEGSPVLTHGRLFIAMRRRFPETQLFVACLDPRTGREIWKHRVCTARSSLGAEQNHVTCNLLTVLGESLYLSTNVGAIASIDLFDGTVRWLATYETRDSQKLADLSNVMKSGLTPCLASREMLVAAPNDADEVFGIDRHSGVIRWRRTLRGGVRHLLGTHAGRLFLSGNRLWALDLKTGATLWNRGFRDPAGFGYGRGLLAGDDVYWPLREEIFVINQSNGAIVRRIALRALHNARGGNLSIARGRLVVAEPNRLVVYGIGPQGKRPQKKRSGKVPTQP